VTEANAGKIKSVTDASGKKTYYAYSTRGELYRTWGDVPYPSEYRYNEFGDLTNLITFRGGSGWTSSTWTGSSGTGDNTFWVYDAASGALTQKIDASGAYVSYAYDTNSARLLNRTWARTVGGAPVSVTNSYDGFGKLISQEYSDGTPNVYFNNYNRAGQPREIVDASGTNELTYDFAGRLTVANYTNGLLSGTTISSRFNPSLGRDMLVVSGTSTALTNTFGYDAYGRMGSVGNGIYSATYSYLPTSDLLAATTYKSNASVILTTSRSWDYGFRLSSITNTAAGRVLSSDGYTYDVLNRRTAAALEDGSYWQYGYNNRHELTGAKRYWLDMSLVAGQQFGFTYDNIGNRTASTSGGDANGASLRTTSYTANNLNQYTTVSIPAFKDIIGVALATNTVVVNGSTASRHGEYFRQEITTSNSSSAVWQNVLTTSGTFTNAGGVALPKTSQTWTYDADGNLTFDGVWNYQWDAENRLASMNMTNVSGVANSNRLKLDFTYDWMSRRVQKVVSAWNGSAFANPATNKFIYDSRNLLVIVDAQLTVLKSFTWGLDLSGSSMDKAGGVGGLVMLNISGTNCFPAYDGNGNITAAVGAANGALLARYDYNPFGILLRATGIFAHQNPFRFSTKFADDETDLVWYGYRYYSPNYGRWISRDPSGEKGGVNLFGFVGNRPISVFDTDGRSWDDVLTVLEIIQAILEQNPNPIVAGPDLEEILRETKESLEAIAIGNAAVQQLGQITALTTFFSKLGYNGTMAVLKEDPSIAYTDAGAFTGPMLSGGDHAGQEAAFEAWMDYVSDPNTQ
jgi:RHS repeat-associated protein